MTFKHTLAAGVAAAMFALPSVALAEGKSDQARNAIAAAKAKIDAVNIVGAAGDAPRLYADAVRELHIAQDELNHHAKVEALRDATHASELADQALAASQRSRSSDQRSATQAAQDQAAQANARAADAQAATARAQAEAAAARAAPPVIVQVPAPVAPPATTTTVSTTTTDEHAAAPIRHRPVHRVVHRRSHTTRHTVRATTTVTTH
ncbi:MAG: hypothetical protein ABIU18_00935 [Novosphingobium sp.]